MKKLQLALALGFILGLTSPAHPGTKTVTGCIKYLRLGSGPGMAYSAARVGDEFVTFGKNKMYVEPRKVSDVPAKTPQDWAKWEKEWGLLMAGAQAKVQVSIMYMGDTTNEVLIIWIKFDSPCQ